jgi:dTDP-4-amino-4,6-dideoxygalactose transaminase
VRTGRSEVPVGPDGLRYNTRLIGRECHARPAGQWRPGLQVPFNELVSQTAALRDDLDAAFARVLGRGRYILGPEVEAFEAEFAAFIGARYAVGVASGTDALEIALRALGVGLGDEVIVPALTAAPTALAVLASGASPVFADVEPDTCTLDPARLPDVFTRRTRAILPVHLYGQPADMASILAFADGAGLAVVEDAAQAHGAEYQGRRVGTLGVLGAFSFYPTKNLGALGDGGLVATNDEALATRVRQIRDLGQDGRYNHVTYGVNSRLDELQAALLRVKLRHLEEWNQARRQRAVWYGELLTDVPGLHPPIEADGRRHVYHLYVVQAERRDALRVWLGEHGIGSDVHYPLPLHRQPVFAEFAPPDGAPVAEGLAERIVSLPMFPHLTREQVEAVAEAVRAFYA